MSSSLTCKAILERMYLLSKNGQLLIQLDWKFDGSELFPDDWHQG